jgi:glucose/arabinose dehydrogenase
MIVSNAVSCARPWGVALIAVACALPIAADAQTLPAGFSRTNAFNGRSFPTAIRFSPDGRVYVAEKSGQIFEYDNIRDTSGTRIADLRTNVHNFWDRGLLGLALDPGFPDQPYLYVLYTHDAGIGGTAPRWGTAGSSGDGCGGVLSNGGATANNGGCNVSGRLSRLTLSAGTTTEQVLVEDWFQQYPSHSIGTVAVGADGFLYAGGGDGASFNFTDYGQSGNPNFVDVDSPLDEGGALRAQDVRTAADALSLSGSVIRVDRRTGLAAPGNPHFGSGAGMNERRMIAHGLRNPFRFTMRPGTSELWLGDVGWNDREEIDVIDDLTAASATAPTNFGWPCYEGVGRQGGYDGANKPLCESLYSAGAAAVRAPFYAYAHTINAGASCNGSGSAVSGLAFYRGTSYPTAYRGALFFADYNRDQIFALPDANQDGMPEAPTLSGCGSTPEPTPYLFANGGDINVVDLTTGPGGDLFYASLDQGEINRVHFGANRAPSAAIRLGAGGSIRGGARAVPLDASNSVDPDTTALTFDWDLDGDGAFDDASGSALTTAIANLPATAMFDVGVRVTDASGASDSARLRLFAGNSPPQATILTPTTPAPLWRAGDTIAVAGGGSDAEDGNLTGDALSWTFLLQHCSDETFLDCHSHPITTSEGNFASVDAQDHEYPAFLRVRFTATDSDGASVNTQRDLFPAVAEVMMATVPASLKIGVGSAAAATTPFVHKTIANGTFSVDAPLQLLGPIEYVFRQWSDGGAQTHLATFPNPGPAALTATFSPHANLALTLTDRTTPPALNAPYVYQMTLANLGGGQVMGVGFSHAPPAALGAVTWTCSATAGATCPAPIGSGAVAITVDLPAGSTLNFGFAGTMPAAPPATIALAASTTPPAGYFDPSTANNAIAFTIEPYIVFQNGFE